MTAATMQAFVKYGNTPGDAGLTTVNVPEPGEGEVIQNACRYQLRLVSITVSTVQRLGGTPRVSDVWLSAILCCIDFRNVWAVLDLNQ